MAPFERAEIAMTSYPSVIVNLAVSASVTDLYFQGALSCSRFITLLILIPGALFIDTFIGVRI